MKAKILILALASVIIFTSCKKSNTGGDVTVAAITKHHDRVIPLSTVYVKYGAKDFPGEDVSKYDASQKTDKEGHTHFEGLRYGNYYFYGIGYDSVSQATVKGGIALKIKWKERKDKIELNVSITE
ncbi:MAG: hypothetical protein Q8L81_11425 [Bacteroidota bacterium]|nr:hypothetical protein [Bacteroidota bacterium]